MISALVDEHEAILIERAEAVPAQEPTMIEREPALVGRERPVAKLEPTPPPRPVKPRSNAVSNGKVHRPPAHVTVEHPPVDNQSRILARFLQMADTYRSEGSLHQALELYFSLLENHYDSPEARQAEECLLDMGRDYERTGERKQARAIYERLL
jgi:hypothetical protein